MFQFLRIVLPFFAIALWVASIEAADSKREHESSPVPWTETQLKIAQKITGLSNDSLGLLLEDGSPLAGKLTDALAAVGIVDDLLSARDLPALTNCRDVVLDKLIGQFASAKGLERFTALLTAFKVYKASLEVVHDHWWAPAMEEDIYTRYKTHRVHNAVWQKREALVQATGSKYHDLRDDWYDRLVKEKGYNKTLIGPELERKLRNDVDAYWMSYLETRYQREKLLEEMKRNKESALDAVLRRQRDEFSTMLVVRAVDGSTGKLLANFAVEADSDKGKEAVGAGRKGVAVLAYRGASKDERGDARLHYGVWEVTVSAEGYKPKTTACLHRSEELTICTLQLERGLQRVLVEYDVTTSEPTSPGSFRWNGSCEATVSFDGDKVVLDFDVSTAKVNGALDNMDESDSLRVTEDTSVWTGRMFDDGVVRMEGKAKYQSTWRETEALDQVGYARFGGDLSATMNGKTLVGTLEARGVTKSTRTEETWIKHVFSFRIDDFPALSNP